MAKKNDFFWKCVFFFKFKFSLIARLFRSIVESSRKEKYFNRSENFEAKTRKKNKNEKLKMKESKERKIKCKRSVESLRRWPG